MIEIGVDTGGTYTDAIVYDMSKKEILSSNKALTTKEDLKIGIKYSKKW
jgi:N-methylhydantoinase A/oxoprolinase/acetone carboxylase beta subunit